MTYIFDQNPCRATVEKLAGRLCHSVFFFNQNLCFTLKSCHLGSFFRHNFNFHTIEGDEGHTMCFFHVIFHPI